MSPLSHAHDLRKGRASLPGQIYLLTTVTHQRQRIFQDWQLGRLVVAAMRHQHEIGHATTLAFVVMPDHLHWLCCLGEGATLSAVMQAVKGRVARQINLVHPAGKLWQPGYHDHALREEEDVQQVARYIVANPLRAGLVKRLGDYPLWDAVWL